MQGPSSGFGVQGSGFRVQGSGSRVRAGRGLEVACQSGCVAGEPTESAARISVQGAGSGFRVKGSRTAQSVHSFSWYPHGGLRPFHQKSTCITQSTFGHHVVQIHHVPPPTVEDNQTLALHCLVFENRSRQCKDILSTEISTSFLSDFPWKPTARGSMGVYLA